MYVFRDRLEAGRHLGDALKELRARAGVVVLALPRGGVPVGAEVAAVLAAPLDVLVVRKLAHPHAPEFALGAVASGGIRVLNPGALRRLGLTAEQVEPLARAGLGEVARREQAYRLRRGLPDVRGKVVILVDDGLATGSTMEAAALAVRQMDPLSIIVAVPVGPPETCRRLESLARVVCLQKPHDFMAVGNYYEDFSQLSDADVIHLLRQSAARR